MVEYFRTPAEVTCGPIPGWVLFAVLHLIGVACFGYIAARRMAPLMHAARDPRFDRPWDRLKKVLQFWLGQWKHPRYPAAGAIHILIFAGFIILATRAFSLLIMGVSAGFEPPGGHIYDILKDYAATIVFLTVIVAAVRRGVFTPARYQVPTKHGKSHTADAIFLLSLIAILMAADALFEGARAAGHTMQGQPAEFLAAYSLPWMLSGVLAAAPLAVLQYLYHGAYMLHEVTFFFLLCYRPFGIQFHVETSLFSIYFAKLDREILKPVKWGIGDGQLDQVKSFGVKTLEDFTWKHLLDFYSCADCGRCADQCPSNAVGRPLAPRFLTIKARDYIFQHYPVLGKVNNGHQLVGTIYSEDEIWSCTTCGACEAECPLLVEYIDKIVDLRRGLVDSGNVPQSLQKPLKSLESRGNPFGKMEKKKGDWVRAKDFQQTCNVRILNGDGAAGTLYFRRQHDLLRRADAIYRAGDRADSGACRRGLRHPGRGRTGQRARGAAVRRGTAVHGAAGPQRRSHPGIRSAAHRHRRSARLQRAEARL
jgi:heterodisulfide reductase subunit C